MLAKAILVIPPLVLCLLVDTSMADESGPCGNDGPTFCAASQFGAGGMLDCLVTHRTEVSPLCRQHLDRLLAYKSECKKEIRSVCRKEKPFYCLFHPSTVQKFWRVTSKRCLSAVLQEGEYLKECSAEAMASCNTVSSSLPEQVECPRALPQVSVGCASLLAK